MRTLILFATKYGTADKCAHLLKCQLDGEVTIQPIDAAESLNGYDTVVIGGSIYMGKLQPTVIQFCRQNQALLLKKKLALYLCCLTRDPSAAFFKKYFPQSLLDHAVEVASFGGEVDFDRLNFLYRMMMKLLMRTKDFEKNYRDPGLLTDEIEKMAKALNQIES